jgi:polysaccharide biosynthesis protein PslG
VRHWLAILLLTVCLAGCSSSAGAAKVPPDFFGVMADGPLLYNGFDDQSEFDLMRQSGVQTIRMAMPWSDMEPQPGQINFTDTDKIVAQAAAHDFTPLPTVTFAPDWAARHPGNSNSPPKGTANYANFIAACVRRYGPGGTFWSDHPEVPVRPIRDWQVWNEPNQPVFNWSDQPFAKDYVALVRAARVAIKGVDPGAHIVLAGLVGTSWSALAKVYAAGGKGLFDDVAIHPFTLEPKNVLKILDKVRAVMARNGDARKPMFITELTWPAAKGFRLTRTYGYEVNNAQQAKKLGQVIPLLVAQRKKLRLERLYWYTWISAAPAPKNDPFSYSGLRQLQNNGRQLSRPSLAVYSRMAHRYE